MTRLLGVICVMPTRSFLESYMCPFMENLPRPETWSHLIINLHGHLHPCGIRVRVCIRVFVPQVGLRLGSHTPSHAPEDKQACRSLAGAQAGGGINNPSDFLKRERVWQQAPWRQAEKQPAPSATLSACTHMLTSHTMCISCSPSFPVMSISCSCLFQTQS